MSNTRIRDQKLDEIVEALEAKHRVGGYWYKVFDALLDENGEALIREIVKRRKVEAVLRTPTPKTWPDCGCDDGTGPDEPSDRGFICPHDPRGFPAPSDASIRLTEEQLVAACLNVGFDLTCGACAMLFYTGFTGPTSRHDAMPPGHDAGCKTTRPEKEAVRLDLKKQDVTLTNDYCATHRVTWDEGQAEENDRCEDCERTRPEHRAQEGSGHLRWRLVALCFGYNELAKLAKTLGEKVYLRLARDVAHQELVKAGGEIDVQREATILELPDTMPRVRFSEKDVGLMRQAVSEHDEREAVKRGEGKEEP